MTDRDRSRAYHAWVSEAIYLPDGDGYIPTALSRGPWSPDHQHGGPPSALMIGVAESLAGRDSLLARATVEILRPIPVKHMTAIANIVRPGKRVQLISVRLLADGTEAATLTSLHIRRHDGLVAPPPLHDNPTHEPPSAGRTGTGFGLGYEDFYEALEVRYLGRTATEPGPTRAWMRLRVPLVAGQEPSGAQRVALAADCGNGVSWEIPFDENLFVNPDLTIYLHRPVEGEWILIDSVTDLGPGLGLAQSALFDLDGQVGRSLQALFVDSR